MLFRLGLGVVIICRLRALLRSRATAPLSFVGWAFRFPSTNAGPVLDAMIASLQDKQAFTKSGNLALDRLQC